MSDDTETNQVSDTHGIDHRDHDADGRKESLRASLEKSWQEQTGRKPEGARDRDDEDRHDDRRAEPRGRGARAAKEAASADVKNRDTASAADKSASANPATGNAALGLDISEAPKSWRADEKAVWPQVPEKARAAFHRREQEGQRGVDDLKRNYAELDAALAPHLPTIKSFGHSSAQAVSQLFAWQNALSNDPKRFFPELMKNYGVSPQDIFPELAAGGYAPQQDAAQQQQFDPRYVQQLIDARLQPIYTVAQQVQTQQAQQRAAQTQQIITDFSKGKKHFENVRVKMAQLIQAGVAGLNEDGSINLNHAYETALHLDPNVWAEVQRETNAQARAAAKAEADRKRYAGSSLSPTSPGRNNFAAGKKPARGKSVRETLDEAVAEARDNARY